MKSGSHGRAPDGRAGQRGYAGHRPWDGTGTGGHSTASRNVDTDVHWLQGLLGYCKQHCCHMVHTSYQDLYAVSFHDIARCRHGHSTTGGFRKCRKIRTPW